MRLVKTLQRLEATAAARALAQILPVGICWTADDVRVDAGDLLDGEMIACDVTLRGMAGTVPLLTIRERVTRDGEDLGRVYDVAGIEIGVVTELQGNLLTLDFSNQSRITGELAARIGTKLLPAGPAASAQSGGAGPGGGPAG